jgi:hypothetical protein
VTPPGTGTLALPKSMSQVTQQPEPAYHLFLDGAQAPALARAVRLLISGEAHEPAIRAIARELLALLERAADSSGRLTVPLTPQQMKIAHTAAQLLLDDLQREQSAERALLRSVLDKLPDEHTMRAIELS